MSRLPSLDELRDRDLYRPTAREMYEAAEESRREMERMFPGGMTMYASKPEEPSEGDMYVEPDGQMMVYAGGEWKKLAMGGRVISTSSGSGTWSTASPYGWDPAGGGERPSWREREEMDRVADDGDNTELLEVLLCPECEMELGSRACGPRHAYLADYPLEHRLIKPLLERYGLKRSE